MSVGALPAGCDGTVSLPERGKNATGVGILVKAVCRGVSSTPVGRLL